MHSITTPTMPSELFVGDRRVTDVSSGFSARAKLGEPERFTAVSADGSEVEAWMLRPAGFEEGKTYPLVLTIHGGPFTQYADRFFDEVQVYAGAGYAVAYSNPRGSAGYSEAWGRAIRGPVEGGPGWGSVDYEDLMAVMDEAVKRFDFIDPDRLGVMGGSYGGFMTSWIIGHTDRFKAACSERAVNDMRTMSWTSDIGTYFQKGYVGRSHLEDPDEYARQSPVTYVDAIHTPLLILHSENDLRCPIEQAEQLFAALKKLGREAEFVRYPREANHGLSRSGPPDLRRDRLERIVGWMVRWLASDP